MSRLGNWGSGGKQRRGETKWGKPKRWESSTGTRVGMPSNGNQDLVFFVFHVVKKSILIVYKNRIGFLGLALTPNLTMGLALDPLLRIWLLPKKRKTL
jgi:hypothetical protein